MRKFLVLAVTSCFAAMAWAASANAEHHGGAWKFVIATDWVQITDDSRMVVQVSGSVGGSVTVNGNSYSDIDTVLGYNDHMARNVTAEAFAGLFANTKMTAKMKYDGGESDITITGARFFSKYGSPAKIKYNIEGGPSAGTLSNVSLFIDCASNCY